MEEIRSNEARDEDSVSLSNSSSTSSIRERTFKRKVFVARPSLLTTLFETGDLVIVYNIFAAIFVLLFLCTLLEDIFFYGVPFFHLWLIAWNFADLHLTLGVWFLMFLSTFVPYSTMKLWAHAPSKSPQNWLHVAGAFVAFLVPFFYFPLKFLFHQELNCACSFIITCETTRLAMKMHSFIRENYERAVERKLSGEKLQPGEQSDWPSVEQYVYYLFCPSFIYRDYYPRTEKIDWRVAGLHLAHALILIEYVNLVFIQFVFPWLSELDLHRQSLSTSLLALFPGIIPGAFCLLCLFYGLLHSWLNFFSEILRFADRLFYLNWWNAKNMADYYRNWNLVVHEWLYTYVYRDVAILIGGRKGRQWAQTMVFFLSAVFHEYWFGIAFRVFYPVMFMLYFVFGVSRLFKSDYVWNMALWFNLLIGTGMFIAFYGQEWYARQRCAPYPVADFMLPRHWACY